MPPASTTATAREHYPQNRVNFADHPSVLKNAFALSCTLGSEAEYVVFVVFWT